MGAGVPMPATSGGGSVVKTATAALDGINTAYVNIREGVL
jgi:hypothetical protein